MPDGCDVVVVGASAGGVEALLRLVRALPGDFRAPILVVLHLPAASPSILPDILARAGALPAVGAEQGMPLEPGHVYVAAPDRHLLISEDHIELDAGARENGHRPAIDPLFRSAADAYGSRAAGVVLSGTLDDGTVGLHCIGERGGWTLVQDPDDALYRAMPANAIAFTRPDYVLGVEELAGILTEIAAGSASRPGGTIERQRQAPDPAAEQAQPGELAPFSCPDCGGTLWETRRGRTASYRCRTGHAFTMNTLVARQAESVERTLWAAYRALEERAAIARRVSRRLAENGSHASAERFARQAGQAEAHAEELKALLDAVEQPVDPGEEAAA